MLFQTALLGSVFFCFGSVGSLGDLDIALPDLGWMARLGAAATLGHYFFTSAYREAPALLLAPVNYLHLIWAGGLGWLVFDHLPDDLGLAGMALVCASGIAIAVRAARKNEPASPLLDQTPEAP